MSLVSFVLIVIGVLLNAIAQLLLKTGTNAIGHFEFTLANIAPIGTRLALEPHILGGVACYVVSLMLWVLALSRTDVSVAYPMLAIGYVVNALAAWYLFDENLNAVRWTGIGFIVLGVFLVVRSG